MAPELILKNISSRVDLDPEESAYILSVLRFKTVTKKELLLKEGDVCKNIYYVNEGMLRAFCLDKEGREATIMFALADWWITDMYCFLNEKPAMMYIEAIADSSLFQLSKEGLENLFDKVPKFERFFRLLMQNAYTREQLRVIENLSLPAEERYESFLKKYPHVASAVTQKQIASYLGVTPEFLSSVRRKKAGK